MPPPTPTENPATPTATLLPLMPVTQSDWIRGPLEADQSFLVYCDFQSPPCAALTESLNTLRELRPGIQVIYRQFPLLVLNDKAGLAAQLALAADAQGEFWSMHDLLYERQQNWTNMSADEFIDWAVQAADELGLAEQQIDAALRGGTYAENAEQAFQAGISSGLPGTPFLLLNGEWFRASPTIANLEAAIRLEELGKIQFTQAPPFEIDTDTLYLAHIQLQDGEVTLRLLPESAPVSVANFIFLANQGWYDGTIFHRVVPGSYVVGGDPTATGFGGPGYFTRDEIDPGLSFDRPGRVAMMSSGPDTNGSQFAITLESMPEWDGSRSIFGQVIDGLSLLSTLDERDPLVDLLADPPNKIINVEIEVQ